MSGVLEHTDFVVKRRPRVFELRAGYDVYDRQSVSALGSVEQVGRDNMEKMLHPQRSDNARTQFELSGASGAVLLITHVQALKSSLEVDLPDGSEVGRIRLENLLGRSRFTLEVAAISAGTLAARTWRRKTFAVVDGRNVEVASIEMTKGTSGDLSHDNQYAVHIDGGLGEPLRALAFAAVIAVDTILWTR
jgi:hypothetical protein